MRIPEKPTMLPRLAVLVACGCALAGARGHAATQFQLQSEIWTNLGGAGGASIKTDYQYDAKGNRVLKESRPYPSLGAVVGSTEYAYDLQGRPSKVVVKAAAETLSVVEYAYGATGDLSEVRTEEKSGSLRFTDSLLYDGAGRLVESRRVTGGALVQTHRMAYDAQGKLVSDTLYEKQGSAIVAAQAVLIGYNSAGSVSQEAHWRQADGKWYQVRTVKMGYDAGSLASRASYVPDRDLDKLEDSVAYSYDPDGNRSEEKGFDDEREPVYSIAFQWKAVGSPVRFAEKRGRGIVIRAGAAGIRVASEGRGPIVINLRDLKGTLVRRATVAHASPEGSHVAGTDGLARGTYLAEAVQGKERKTTAVTLP